MMDGQETTEVLDPQLKTEIDALSREQMARLWRFAPSEHRFFCGRAVSEYFAKRFFELGGWSPELSKRIGWGD
jgi:hypothetical protein